MHDLIFHSSMDDLLMEGRRLAKQRPGCHKTNNDLAAATLIVKMHAAGFDVDPEDVEGCIRRMRIAVDTGIYPDALLTKSSTPAAAGA